MQLVLKIPEKDVPRRQEIMTIDLHFIEGTVCASSYPCEVLPKGHGDLIDRRELLKQPMDKANYPSNYVNIAPTIIEADGGDT